MEDNFQVQDMQVIKDVQNKRGINKLSESSNESDSSTDQEQRERRPAEFEDDEIATESNKSQENN